MRAMFEQDSLINVEMPRVNAHPHKKKKKPFYKTYINLLL